MDSLGKPNRPTKRCKMYSNTLPSSGNTSHCDNPPINQVFASGDSGGGLTYFVFDLDLYRATNQYNASYRRLYTMCVRGSTNVQSRHAQDCHLERVQNTFIPQLHRLTRQSHSSYTLCREAHRHAARTGFTRGASPIV